jgi:hypothetical protein
VKRAAIVSVLVLLGLVVDACSSKGSGAGTGTPTMPTDPNAMYTGPLGTPAYWLQNTSLKVQPTTAPGAMAGEIDLEGPRASVESYQIVVRPTGGGMSGVNATASDLKTAGGDTIPAANVTLFREFFVDFGSIDRTTNQGGVLPAPESSPTHDSRVPDPLIPFVDSATGNPLGAPFGVASESTCRSGSTSRSRRTPWPARTRARSRSRPTAKPRWSSPFRSTSGT